jgi:hypothetical protein
MGTAVTFITLFLERDHAHDVNNILDSSAGRVALCAAVTASVILAVSAMLDTRLDAKISRSEFLTSTLMLRANSRFLTAYAVRNDKKLGM